MTHQVNKCRCGRTMHWPGNARTGTTWTCKKCGTITTLVPRGTSGADSSGVVVPSQPLKAGPSFAPPQRRARIPAHPRPHRQTPRPPGLLGQLAHIFGLRLV